MSTATADTETKTGTKTEVFTAEELKALRKALNEGRNGKGTYVAPPAENRDESDDWRNDVELLVKFLKDLNDVLSTVITTRLPPQDKKRFDALLKNLQPTIDDAIEQLRGIRDLKGKLADTLRRVGLLGEALLAKLDELRDRIIEGPLVGVLEMFDTILDSLIAAIEILEPLKELKDTIKNKIEFGADGGIIAMNIYPYRARPDE